MAVTNVYDVTWHWENGGTALPGTGKSVNNQQQDMIVAASSDYATIKNVIVGNQGKAHGGSVFVIDAIANIGPANIEL